MEINKNEKNETCFICEKCNFKCSYKCDWNRHLLTAKHKMEIMEINRKSKKTTTQFKCECGKIYSSNSGLWKHKKKCKYLNVEEEEDNKIVEENNDNEPSYRDLLIQAMKEMSEMRKEMVSMIPKIGNITTNSHNTTNNTFNLQFFLNETCKDALNITDFINSLKLQLEDFEYTAENGHIKGITNIFQTALMNMDQTKRPLHCTDLKRETLYIKDNDEWNKDETKDKMKEVVDKVTNNNLCNMSKWLEKYPGHTDPNSKDFDKYTKMTSNCMGSGEETDNEKIIRNVLKEVQIKK